MSKKEKGGGRWGEGVTKARTTISSSQMKESPKLKKILLPNIVGILGVFVYQHIIQVKYYVFFSSALYTM